MDDLTPTGLAGEIAAMRADLDTLRADLAPIIELFANLQRTMAAGPPAGGPMAMLAMLRGIGA